MRVLITGATGSVGREIVKQCLANNIAVNYLTTNRSKIEHKENYQGYYWNPFTGDIDCACFQGVERIINLAGSSIAKRWTKTNKKEILESRVSSLKLLFESVRDQGIEIKQLVSASAIGIYPDSLTNYYREDHEITGRGFLSEVSVKWEDQVRAFEDLGISTSIVRIGIVLTNDGGAFPQIVKPVRMGFGAAFGSGEQWQSWIHIEDLGALFLHIFTQGLSGCFNGVAPNALKQKDLIKSVAKSLKRPVFLPPIPEFLLRMILGEMSALLLESQHVSSRKIENRGFVFKHHHIETALEDLLKSS
jgi:uncharacterized protein (TIGR01777 family)